MPAGTDLPDTGKKHAMIKPETKSHDRDRPLGNRLFTYAVIADTHLNQGETECNSPYEVNRLANARMRYVVRDLNARDVAFVVNLGDLVHPVPAVPGLYERAANEFLGQVKDLRHKLYLVPGNHDIGDKPVAWGPAGVVRNEFLDLWRQYFGEHFYAFDSGGCHFVVINAQIINSGLDAEAAQRTWLERDLATHKGARIFVNIHYPPYLTFPNEDEHYDNIAEPGRSWLLRLIEVVGVEALFAGHVHNFWYCRHARTDFYYLPSTAFVRHDYSELYRIGPGPEAGRNDAPKLGYFLVHVHERGHTCEIVRTYGRAVGPEAPLIRPEAKVVPLHPRENWRAPLGFDLRQNWMEAVQISPSGGLDEFDRKHVRNDYGLMALWEMGVRNVRIPLRDLASAAVRDRVRVLMDHGQRFTLFSYCSIPDADMEVVRRHRDCVDAWEIAGPWEDFEQAIAGVMAVRADTGLPVYFSKLRSKEELEGDGEKYFHVINHGFTARDGAQIQRLTAAGIDGAVFRVASEQSPWEEILAVAALCGATGLNASVHVRMSATNPATFQNDETWAAHRVAEALFAAVSVDGTKVFIDTFDDADRGYFPRVGVVDRRFNPHLGFHVVRHLYAALNAEPAPLVARWTAAIKGARIFALKRDAGEAALVLPESAQDRIAISGLGSATHGWRTSSCTAPATSRARR